MIDKKEKMYNVIHTIDPNVDPDILTLGSNIFKFIKKKKDKFILDIKNNDGKLKEYSGYSEENMCRTFSWLKENYLIYYSEKHTCYVLTNFCIDALDLKKD